MLVVNTKGIDLYAPFKRSSENILYDSALKNYTNRDMEMVLGGIYDMLMKQVFILMTCMTSPYLFLRSSNSSALHDLRPKVDTPSNVLLLR